jgi:hypothetical protein
MNAIVKDEPPLTRLMQQLGNERIWILARLEPRADGIGIDKIPTDPLTGRNSDANDCSFWMTGPEAVEAAEAWNAQRQDPVIEYGVGLTMADGRFCFDLDHCRQGDGWAPYASNFIARFPNAYVEVSQSRESLHVMGYCSEIPAHRTRNRDFRMEAYSQLRFIYVTGYGAYGDVRTDLTNEFKLFVAQFFRKGETGGEIEWSDQPVPEWSGPTDDEALLEIALHSRSRALDRSRATFRDLWTANEGPLSRSFPPQGYGVYDPSGADLAMANHLAFFTGKNPARIERLMRLSALRRPKWDTHSTYLRELTIARACADCKEVYKGASDEPPSRPELSTTLPAVPPPPVDVTNVPPPPGGTLAPPATERGELILLHAQQALFAGCVYVQDIHEMADPDGFMLSKAQFDAHERFSGRDYRLSDDGGTTDSAWEAFTQSKIYAFPQVRGTRFDPREPEGAIITRDGLKFVNIWRDPRVRSAPGNASRFVSHIQKLLPYGDDAVILLCYLAACVQHRGVKSPWSPFIQGIEGNGKSLIGESVMRYCLGARYTHKARADKLDGQFNAAFYGKLLILVDDVKARSSVWEVLKPMITDGSMEIEPKGVDKVTREVCFNFIFTANPKDGLKKSATDRRICPLYCAQQEDGDLERDGLTEQYFVDLFRWLDHEDGYAITLNYLQKFEIDPRYNFAAGCVRAPRTTSTDEALRVGLGAARQRLQELIDAGDTKGFKGGWINWRLLNGLLDEDADGKRMTPGERREMLAGMRYVRHPGLNAGQTSAGQLSNPLPDGSRPVLYIKRDHPCVDYRGAAVAAAYWATQIGQAPPPPPPDT